MKNAISFFQPFAKQYSLSKTLRFELKPVGKTLENIQKKGLIEQDLQRASNYKKLKKTIDEYHKAFIELAMADVHLSKLDNYLELYLKSPEEKTDSKIQTTLQANFK